MGIASREVLARGNRSLSNQRGSCIRRVHFFDSLGLDPGLRQLVGFGQPASTPPFDEMWSLWHAIVRAADIYLNELKPEDLQIHFVWEGKSMAESVGILLLRNIYHY